VTNLFAEEAERKLGSAGRPLPNMEVRLVSADNQSVPTGEAGEILVRSPALMTGYLNSPEHTETALEDGWLRTGDVGVLDEEGYLSIVDRCKDMLISGGLNVYPAEVERVLDGFPGLNEFSIIGVPDDRWGEVPLLVVADWKNLDLEAIYEFCREELADYKRPKYIANHGAPLPRTLGGKVTKPTLRAYYISAPDEMVQLKTEVLPTMKQLGAKL
jgi:fatty-acyl-CoA synthase